MTPAEVKALPPGRLLRLMPGSTRLYELLSEYLFAKVGYLPSHWNQ